jgi:hypothetical protein
MNQTSKRGGWRPGSGRKKGSGKGRVSVTGSLSMPREMWERLDAMRGSISRGKWLASILQNL